MKHVFVLEAIKPLQGAGKALKSTLTSAMGAVTAITTDRKIRVKAKKLLYVAGVLSGAMAFISVCLSMEVTSVALSFISLACFWIEDEITEKGGAI